MDLAPGTKVLGGIKLAPGTKALGLLFSVVVSTLWSTPYGPLAAAVCVLGLLFFQLTHSLIPSFAAALKAKGFSGVDLNKTDPELIKAIRSGETNATDVDLPRVPESVGVIPAFAYLIGGIIGYLLIRFYVAKSDENLLVDYICGLLTASLMTFLGFLDDVLDLRWRYKVTLPVIAAIPVLVFYRGPTTVILPTFLRGLYHEGLFGAMGFYRQESFAENILSIDFGWFYFCYMLVLCLFCSNAINIYAGVNGLEVGQSLITSGFVIIHNCLELRNHQSDPHMLSLVLSVVFFSVSYALWGYNKFPAKVFVGDSFTMLAGVHFAISAIMSHYAKTMLLFFLPQILNALYSVPQLLKIVHCPRHRVPHYDPKTGKMRSSRNLTIINLALEICGPMTEKRLVNTLLIFQVICCTIGMLIRYSPAYNLTFV